MVKEGGEKIDNRWVGFGVFYPANHIAKDDSGMKRMKDALLTNDDEKIKEAYEGIYYLTADTLDSLDLLDMHMSSDDENPHGNMRQDLMECLKQPAETGIPIKTWRNKDGDYMMAWVTQDTKDGRKQAFDIITGRKTELSLMFDTTLKRSRETGETELIFKGRHVAVVGHDEQRADRPRCVIKGIIPLCPELNTMRQEVEAQIQKNEEALQQCMETYSKINLRQGIIGATLEDEEALQSTELDMAGNEEMEEVPATTEQASTQDESPAPAEAQEGVASDAIDNADALAVKMGISDPAHLALMKKFHMASEQDVLDFANKHAGANKQSRNDLANFATLLASTQSKCMTHSKDNGSLRSEMELLKGKLEKATAENVSMGERLKTRHEQEIKDAGEKITRAWNDTLKRGGMDASYMGEMVKRVSESENPMAMAEMIERSTACGASSASNPVGRARQEDMGDISELSRVFNQRRGHFRPNEHEHEDAPQLKKKAAGRAQRPQKQQEEEEEDDDAGDSALFDWDGFAQQQAD